MNSYVSPVGLPSGLTAALLERQAVATEWWREGKRLYLLAEGDGQRLFGRASDDSADQAVLAHEVQIRALLGQAGPLAVPAVLDFGQNWMLERAVSGTRWSGTEAKTLAQASEQIARLAIPSAPSVFNDRYRRAAVVARRVRQVVRPALALDAVRARRILGSSELPSVTSHGDFHPGNVLFEGGRVWVFDWELSGVRPYGYDLMQFRANLVDPSERASVFQVALDLVGKKRESALLRLAYAL